MLTQLTIKNFKLFKDETPVPLSQINLLTGINGRGKSSVLQSFLLFKQTIEFNKTSNRITFNGNYLNLGNIQDVKNINSSQRDNLEFGFKYLYNDIAFNIKYILNAETDDSLDATISKIEISDCISIPSMTINEENDQVLVNFSSGEVQKFPSFFNLFVKAEGLNNEIFKVEKLLNFNKIHYISPDHIGPRVYFSKESLEEFPNVGVLGKNTVNLLWQKKQNAVFENLCEDNKQPRNVLNQLNYWINKIFDGARIKVDEITGEDLLYLKISTTDSTEYFKATNVGFGYSYILPILVSGLIAQAGEIFVIENPEAHLHPYAQSALAKFLSLVSQNGVQILIESHSEHILNGLRISVKDALIAPEQLNVLYFDKVNDKLFDKIDVDIDGGISNWPTKFFDQASNDLNHLLGL